MSESNPQPAPAAELIVKSPAARRIAAGHRWVFSNEILSEDGAPAPGGEILVKDKAGALLGSAIYNRNALIRARLYSREETPCDEAFLRSALERSIKRREIFMPGRKALRLIHGESDSAPGLFVDRYGDYLSIQFLSAGMEKRRTTILRLLQEFLRPTAIVERNDSPSRVLEGLPQNREVAAGELPDSIPVEIHGMTLRLDLMSDNPSEFSLIQSENWRLAEAIAEGRKTLDLFCGSGAFALTARKAGALSVRAIDQNASSLSRLLLNANANGLDAIRPKESDAFAYIKSFPETFDLIHCDPPESARSRKQKDAALRQNRELATGCLRMLNPGGVFIYTLRSAAISGEEFDRMLQDAAGKAGRTLRLLGGALPADHPPLIGMPETNSVKVRTVEAAD